MTSADREVIATRVLLAPRELVWKAWTDPKHVAQWWGPNGFTGIFHAARMDRSIQMKVTAFVRALLQHAENTPRPAVEREHMQ